MLGSQLLEVMGLFLALIVLMESWVCTYLQICHVVYIKYVQLFAYQLYFNKVTDRVVKKQQHTIHVQ